MASLQTKLTNEDGIAHEAFTRLAAAADEFEGYAHPHAERIAALSGELAKLFGLGRADRASLRLAALAHDFGEVAMKRDYIRRAAPLTFEERLDLARHPVIGEQEAARAGADRGAQLLVRWHQEWWNGTGYPDALSREQIPLAARILRVADGYAALTDARPFRPALTEEEARTHLAEWAGLEFDPQVVRAFLTLKNLPALRSYACRDEDALTTMTTATETGAAPQDDEPRADASTTDSQDWNIGGHIPEHGTNPYVQRIETNAETTPLGGEQSSNADQDFSNLTKADPERHA
jgi:HD-GYP domain-containing protein (c-di-GMP phosphodiesterase class II)